MPRATLIVRDRFRDINYQEMLIKIYNRAVINLSKFVKMLIVSTASYINVVLNYLNIFWSQGIESLLLSKSLCYYIN